MYKVLKPFRTTLRRFAPDAVVSALDLAGPVPVATWLRLGNLVEIPAEPPAAGAGTPRGRARAADPELPPAT